MPWPWGSVFPGAPLCSGPLVSPGLPSGRAVPTQGPRGQAICPPLNRAPSCARAPGVCFALTVAVASVLASPASTASGRCLGFPRPGTEPCAPPTVPEVLQLSDALRDDVLPELGVRLEDHEGGSSGCDGGARWGARCGWLSRGELLGWSEGTAPFTRSAGPDRASWASRQPLLSERRHLGLCSYGLTARHPDSAGTCPLGGSLCHVDRQRVSQLVF